MRTCSCGAPATHHWEFANGACNDYCGQHVPGERPKNLNLCSTCLYSLRGGCSMGFTRTECVSCGSYRLGPSGILTPVASYERDKAEIIKAVRAIVDIGPRYGWHLTPQFGDLCAALAALEEVPHD